MINTEKNLKFRKLFDSSTIVQIPVIAVDKWMEISNNSF